MRKLGVKIPAFMGKENKDEFFLFPLALSVEKTKRGVFRVKLLTSNDFSAEVYTNGVKSRLESVSSLSELKPTYKTDLFFVFPLSVFETTTDKVFKFLPFSIEEFQDFKNSLSGLTPVEIIETVSREFKRRTLPFGVESLENGFVKYDLGLDVKTLHFDRIGVVRKGTITDKTFWEVIVVKTGEVYTVGINHKKEFFATFSIKKNGGVEILAYAPKLFELFHLAC